MKQTLYGLLTISVFVTTGCGGSKPLPGPPPYPVHGMVTYQGQPAVGFRMALFPVKPWPGAQFAPSAVTNANGQFQLGSYTANDGAPAGDYIVTFTWPKHVNTLNDDRGEPEIDQLQGRYADVKRALFRVTVQAGSNELPSFNLK